MVEIGFTTVAVVYVPVAVLDAVVATNGFVPISKLLLVVRTMDVTPMDTVVATPMYVVHQPP